MVVIVPTNEEPGGFREEKRDGSVIEEEEEVEASVGGAFCFMDVGCVSGFTATTTAAAAEEGGGVSTATAVSGPIKSQRGL